MSQLDTRPATAVADPPPTRCAGDPLRPASRSSTSTLFCTWLILTIASGCWLMISERAWFAFAGSLACLMITTPLVLGRQRYDWLSPWTLVMLGVYLGYGIRGFAIAFRLDGSRSTSQLFLLGYPESYFYAPSLQVLTALAVLTAGYLASPRSARAGKDATTGGRKMVPGRVYFAVIVCAAAGFSGFLLYVAATGGPDLSALSAKRTTINDASLDTSTYQSFGHYRVLGTFSAIAFWLLLAHYAASGARRGLDTPQFWLLSALFVNAVLLPIYSSTRATVALIVVGAFVIEWTLRGAPRRRTIAVVVVALLLGISALTALRAVSQGVTTSVSVTGETFVDTFVVTRTFSDLATSSNIIRAVPDRLPYASGDTVVAWLAAPVPRAVWPEKPIVSAGPIIGSLLYGNERSGVPPGLIAEAYWNFGLTGSLLIPLLVGLGLGLLHRRVISRPRLTPQLALVIGAITFRVGLDAMSNSLGYALFQAVQMGALLLPVLWFVSGSAAVSPRDRTAMQLSRRHGTEGNRVASGVPCRDGIEARQDR